MAHWFKEGKIMIYDKGYDHFYAWSVTKSVGKKLDELYHGLPQNFENNSKITHLVA